MIVTRFAPSPTGDLHLGGALVAFFSFWLARKDSGRFVVRMEDLDTPRVVPGAADRIRDDLKWLGLEWDEWSTQSERLPVYDEAIRRLAPHCYPCDCSRAEIARVASAPHEGEEIVYPGLCRDRDPNREMKREPAIRLRLPERTTAFTDGFQGLVTAELSRAGDPVLRRGDGVFAYQLAVVVDDLAAQVTDVVRGEDLLSSTPRQRFLAELLGSEPPRYWHVPLVRDASGERIAKRTRGASVRALREGGIRRERILGELARASGLRTTNNEITPKEIGALIRGSTKISTFTVLEEWRHFASERGDSERA